MKKILKGIGIVIFGSAMGAIGYMLGEGRTLFKCGLSTQEYMNQDRTVDDGRICVSFTEGGDKINVSEKWSGSED